MESPLFVDIVLYAIYALTAVAVVLTAWSVARGLRLRGTAKAQGYENGVPARRIALLAAGDLVLTMVVTGLTASVEPLNINGKIYNDVFWLRVSDMLIHTAIVLVILVACVIVFSSIKSQLIHHVPKEE